MAPQIGSIVEENGVLRFRLSNVDVSVANSIRRTILSDIPCWVFKGFPYDDSTIDIKKNTSRFNNEIIKHRLSCVPVHITDDEFPSEKYEFILDVTNDTDSILLVTTQDIQAVDKDTGKKVAKTEMSKIFPADPVTGDHIQLLRLRPKITESLSGESINLVATLTRSTANEDGAFNVASACSYAMSPDVDRQAVVLKEHLQSVKANLQASGMSKAEIDKEIDFAKREWMTLTGKTIVDRTSFDFMIETVGIYSNEELLRKACQLMSARLRNIKALVQEPSSLADLISVEANGMYHIRFPNEDWTSMRVLEQIVFKKFVQGTMESEPVLDYCSSAKPHPHIPESFLIIHFINNKSLEDTNYENALAMVSYACNEGIEIYDRLNEILPK